MPAKKTKPADAPDVVVNAEVFKKHDAEQNNFVHEGAIPGYAETVLHRGQVVHQSSNGFADIEAQTPFSDKTIVRLFSMTKPLTAVALMRLVEQGKVDLRHPVSKYLPSFKCLSCVSHANQVRATAKDDKIRNGPTLQQLLVHTSGLSYGAFFGQAPKYACERSYEDLVAGVDAQEISSIDRFVQELSKLPLRFQPGDRWEYSHGVDVLGRVIEVVSGKSLQRYLNEAILSPLEMHDTSFTVARPSVRRLAALYSQPKEGDADSKLGRLDGGAASAWVEGNACTVAAGGGFMGSSYPTSDGSSSVGGLVSTLHDYLRFVNMLASKGKCPTTGRRVLSETTVDSFFANWLSKKGVTKGQKRLKGWHTDGRGKMGWGPLGQVSLGDSDTGSIWMGGIAGTFFAIDRKRELVCLTVTQATEAYDFYGERLWEAAKEALTVKQSNEAAEASAPKRRKTFRA